MKISDKTLLLVEDENTIREYLGMFIERHSEFAVTPAKNGKEAITLFSERKPQCVFLDLGLPDMHGLDVLKKIREVDATAKVYILTGFDDDAMRQKAKELGATAYLTKPVEFDLLLKIIQEQSLSVANV
jgi:two-component system response regulator (stage 0 sporulation protein F)